MTLGLTVRHYITQKFETDRSDCQDALAFDSTKGLFCVADGATEAYGSRYWARLLAKSWVRFSRSVDEREFVELVGCLGDHAHERWSNKSLPWYAEEKLRAGSFAAFIGLSVSFDDRGISWKALSVGDCCLFHLRAGELLTSLPLSTPSDFSNRPVLLCSLKVLQETLTESIRLFDGTAAQGDTFILMSDAVACWFLKDISSEPALASKFQRLMAEGQTDEMDIFIDELRSTTLKNDDVAVIYIKVGD